MMTRVAATMGLVMMLVIGAIGAPARTSAAGAELVVNGGFELPDRGSSFGVYSSIPGWQSAGGVGFEVQNRIFAAHGGNQIVELDSTASSAMFQDIATVPGGSYTVSFWVSPRPNVSAADNILSASWDGGLLQTISSGVGGSTTAWIQYAYTVTATSTSTRLQFADAGISNSLGSLLDDVSVTSNEVQYGICTLYDVTKPVKAGATKPIKLHLCDAAGNNLSSPSLVLYAVNLIKLDGTVAAVAVEDAGQANPDWDFRYDADLAGYIYNLSTGGLTTGTWQIQFTVNGGQIVYGANFDVK